MKKFTQISCIVFTVSCTLMDPSEEHFCFLIWKSTVQFEQIIMTRIYVSCQAANSSGHSDYYCCKGSSQVKKYKVTESVHGGGRGGKVGSNKHRTVTYVRNSSYITNVVILTRANIFSVWTEHQTLELYGSSEVQSLVTSRLTPHVVWGRWHLVFVVAGNWPVQSLRYEDVLVISFDSYQYLTLFFTLETAEYCYFSWKPKDNEPRGGSESVNLRQILPVIRRRVSSW